MGDVLPLLKVQAPVDRVERWRTNTRWGDLSPSTLAGVLQRGADGDGADLVDLCEFAIGSDAELASLYDSRITRVLQAEFTVKPNPFGDKALAKQAADLVSECIARIPDWHQVQRDLLHAIAVGHACGENEWAEDKDANLKYVARIDFRHGHRFRYDEVWQLRLYDQGMKRGPGSLYGEALIPHKWTIHQYRLLAGYPGIGGLMRSCLWWWLFGRMAERWWLTSTERYGSPMMHVEVPKGTAESVRRSILNSLDQLLSDHMAVVDQDVKFIVDATAAAVKSHEGYIEFTKKAREAKELVWLGMKDATGPGDNGGRASAETRTGAMLDPRMVADGLNFGASLQSTLIRSLVYCNQQRFSVPVERVPLPVYGYLTNDDTTHGQVPVKVEDLMTVQDGLRSGRLSYESAVAMVQMANPGVTEDQARKVLGPPVAAVPSRIVAPVAAPNGAPSTAAPTAATPDASADKAADSALNGAQVTSLLEVIDKVVDGRLPRSAAVKILARAYSITPAEADDMLDDVGRGFVPSPPPGVITPPPIPSAQSKLAVGNRVKVRPGKEHAPEHADVAGTVKISQGEAIGVEFDSAPGQIHKWYAPDELTPA